MFTGKPEFERLIYKVEKTLKSYTVYRLTQSSDPYRCKLSDLIRLEPFRGKSDTTGAQIILRGRDGAKWAKQTITGLRPTNKKLVFYGDYFQNGKRELMIFTISEDRSILVIDFYHGFYPNHSGILGNLI